MLRILPVRTGSTITSFLNGSVCGVKKAGYSAGCQLPFHLYPLLRHFRSKLYLTPPPGSLRLCLVRERGQPAR